METLLPGRGTAPAPSAGGRRLIRGRFLATTMRTVSKLLVSVRCVAEAKTALRAGAALIDVKEPSAGSLGRSADTVVSSIVKYVAGRCPVSAAIGELRENTTPFRDVGLTYVKCGLSGYGVSASWQKDLAALCKRVHRTSP